nr:MAG TPA: hypothetical protein [Caudoviricetes sp.]
MTPKPTKNPFEISAAQKKLIAESLCNIVTNLVSSGRPAPAATVQAARLVLETEIMALNAQGKPKEGA